MADTRAGQPSLLPSAHLRSLAGLDSALSGGKAAATAKSSLSADASSAASHRFVKLHLQSHSITYSILYALQLAGLAEILC